MGDSVSTDSACPTCGGGLPEEARFCPRCGSRVGDEEVPPTSPEYGPVALAQAERRTFGITPPLAIFALGFLAFAFAVYCLATGRWIAGAVLLIVGAGLAMFFVETARRLPDGRLARTAVDLTDRARGRAGFVWLSLSTWSHAGRETVRLRGLQHRLRHEQTALITELGKAVYHGDNERADELKAEARALGERIEDCSVQLQSALDTARSRVGRERMGIQPTQALVGEQPGNGGSPKPAE